MALAFPWPRAATRALGLFTLLVCTHASAGPPLRRVAIVPSDGAKLYLELRAADSDAPLLLWLHGGPGAAERPLFRAFDAALERSFVVAYLDQRGAGRSFDADADPARLTIRQHVRDLGAVVEFLRAELGDRRVTLVGHSWGSALAMLYAAEHPEELVAVIGTGQVVATREAHARELAFVHAEAARRGDRRAQAELDEIGEAPFDSVDEMLRVERLTDRFGGLFHHPPARWSTLLGAIWRGDATLWEIGRLIRANRLSLEAMHAELLALDLRVSVPRVGVPVCFLLGRFDRHVDADLAASYFAALDAPAKRLVWFEASAHNVPFEEPERFATAVRECAGGLGAR